MRLNYNPRSRKRTMARFEYEALRLAMRRAGAVAIGAILLATALPGRDEKAQKKGPTFYKDVLPILQGHCQECHRAEGIAPFALQTYGQTKHYAAAIAIAAKNRSMPPWFADPSIGKFSNATSLGKAQIAALIAWAKQGAPKGNPNDAPPPRHWSGAWTIPNPDFVVKMSEPVAVPARGDVDYTYEIVPTHFRKDRWIQMTELLPGARAHVHHAVVYIRPPHSRWLEHAPIGKPFTADTLTDPKDRRDAKWTDADILIVYAPGSSPGEYPSGAAKFIPAGSDLVFQMHYMTNGQAASDRSRVGLVIARQKPKERVLTLQLTNDQFVIPPGDPDYRVQVWGTLPNDATLLSFFPHMHLRGKTFEYDIVHHNKLADEGILPEQLEIEPLLRVNYHFHWQMSYILAKPMHLKAGTELQAVAYYDNSKDNPHNPNPTVAVRWGDQTSDEMMVGFFDVAVPAWMDKQRFFQREAKKN
jgi:mono/diheme cytochrome c family protein